MRKTVSVAVLYADIAKSTQLYDILGDKRAQTQISTWLQILSDVTSAYGGFVIKKIGDEVLCTFRDVTSAVSAGKGMHQALDRIPVEGFSEVGSPNIYVGINWGKIIMDSGDIYGDVVNVASRLVNLAKQRQIILSEEAVGNLSAHDQSHVKFLDTEVIKGKFEEICYYEYVWEQQDQTMIVNKSKDKKALLYYLELRSKDKIALVDQIHPWASFGRQGHNDFLLTNKRVSRTHARIEYRWGKFVLIDQSSNGTFLYDMKDKKRYLKREEIVLPVSGYLNFGEEAAEDSPEIVVFTRKRGCDPP